MNYKLWWPVCAISFFFLSFRGEKTPREKKKRRKNALRKKRKNDMRKKRKITPCEKTKPATRKDEILAGKDEKTPCEKTPFETNCVVFSCGSSFSTASFRLFAWHYLWKRIGTPLMLSYSTLKDGVNTTTQLNISPYCYIFIAFSLVIFL